MFEEFQRRVVRQSDLGPQPQEGQHILDRALRLGALSPSTARSRADLDGRDDRQWAELVACGYLREADAGQFYLSHADGTADRVGGQWSPRSVLLAVVIAVGVILLLVRRLGL
jgi:hypothetical protein